MKSYPVISSDSYFLFSKYIKPLKMGFPGKLLFFLCLYVSGIATVYCQENQNWYGFHGSDRQNKSAETGLLNAWPEAGPPLVWKVNGIGEGYSSVAIADGLLYTSGKSDNQTYVYAFDLNGKPVWKKPNGAAWDVQVAWANTYNGSRSTPTYDNGIVYHLSEAGRLSAYKSKTGELIWARELTRDFQAEIPMYGYSESVLIDGNNLYVRPAGKIAHQVCLNKKTGETVWANNEIPGTCGYNSLIIKDFGGFRQIIGASSNCFYSVDVKTGKLLWKFDYENRHSLNCVDAITFNEYVFITTTGKGCTLLRMKPLGGKLSVETVWQNDQVMDNYHGGILLHNGYVYGAGNTTRSWFCIEFLTGKQMWKTPGMGSLTFADGMVYLYDEKGTMKLVKASADSFEKTGEFKVLSGGKGPYWAHPVVCAGRLYLRHNDGIFAYDLGKK
jgi:outer membrane protein assembly factor BamB